MGRMSFFSSMIRSLRVFTLFAGIFLSFYRLSIRRKWHRESWYQAALADQYVTAARRFRNTAVEMGGLLIKLGQFFSTRVDLLPTPVIQELSGLQDEVSPVDYIAVKATVEGEFGCPLESRFLEFDPVPLASASLGQVHRAIKPDGKPVAVKVLRPAIEEIIRIDLSSVRRVISMLELFTDWSRFIDFTAIYREFRLTLLQELDYMEEGRHAEAIAANLKNDPGVLIPAIDWSHTTRRVLTMEYMEGIKITNHTELERLDINRKRIASRLLQTYIRQVLVDGFFHADPHPGNLFVSARSELILVDFGMVGAIPQHVRPLLIKMVMAAVKGDNQTVVSVFKRLGFLRPDADNEVVARAVGVVIEQMLGSGEELTDGDLAGFLKDLERLLYEQPFQIPANYTFLGRALGTLYGICLGLDPDFNFLEEAKPYLTQFAGGKEGVFNTMKAKAGALATALIETPPLAERTLRRLERGEITVTVPLGSVSEPVQALTAAVTTLSWAVVFAALLLTSAYMLLHHLAFEGQIGLGLSGLILLIIMIRSRRTGKKRRFKPHPPVMVKREDPPK